MFEDGRPSYGLINLNQRLIYPSRDRLSTAQNVIMHDTIKILGFEQSYFEVLGLRAPAAGEVGGQQVALFTGRRAVRRMNRFYKCKDSPPEGIYINDKDEGEHDNWLFQIYGNLLMSSHSARHQKLSQITLAALDDLGFYRADFGLADKITFGRRRGCPFIELNGSNDPTQNEGCFQQGATGCNADRKFQTVCGVGGQSDDRLFKYPIRNCSDPGESFFFGLSQEHSTGSRCFDVLESNARANGACYAFRCDRRRSVTIFVGDSQVVCSRRNEEMVVPNREDGLKIVCPDPRRFCRYEADLEECPDKCTDRGQCMRNNECFCEPAFVGDACEQESGIMAILAGPERRLGGEGAEVLVCKLEGGSGDYELVLREQKESYSDEDVHGCYGEAGQVDCLLEGCGLNF